MKQFVYDEIGKQLWEWDKNNYKEWIKKEWERTWRLLNRYDPKPPLDKSQGFISFNPLDKNEVKIPEKARIKITVAKFLVRKLELNKFTNDEIIRKISDKINENFFGEVEIRLDKGSKITENYANNIGGNSCMSGDYSKCTMLYEMNPDRFEQLVVVYANDTARAIVELLDNGKKNCDRVYATSDFVETKLEEYAKSKGWKDQSRNDLIMSGLNFKDGCVPYMDTLRYYRIEKNKLIIFNRTRNRIYVGCLESTCGNIYGGTICCSCDEPFDEEDLYRITDEWYCEDCYNGECFYCQECETNFHNDYKFIIQGNSYCENCANSLGIECDYCDETVHRESCIVTNLELDICDKCKENYFNCVVCNKWFDNDDNYEGDYCEDCYKEKLEDEDEEVVGV